MPTVSGVCVRPFICAHACTVDGGPPNTLAGLQALVAKGVEMAEVDVRLTRDGILVAHHDERLPDGRPLRLTSSVDLGRAYPDESRPALLEELLAAVGSRTRLQLDLKEEGIEEAALAHTLRALPAANVVVTTLSAGQVARVKQLRSEVRVGLSLNRSPGSFLRGLSRARRAGADLLAVHHSYLRTWLPARAARAKLPLFAWTVDADAQLQRVLRDPRVACVITSRPLRASELRNKLGA
jgi:glycerophosphoryl diester phosphodiesterase